MEPVEPLNGTVVKLSGPIWTVLEDVSGLAQRGTRMLVTIAQSTDNTI